MWIKLCYATWMTHLICEHIIDGQSAQPIQWWSPVVNLPWIVAWINSWILIFDCHYFVHNLDLLTFLYIDCLSLIKIKMPWSTLKDQRVYLGFRVCSFGSRGGSMTCWNLNLSFRWVWSGQVISMPLDKGKQLHQRANFHISNTHMVWPKILQSIHAFFRVRCLDEPLCPKVSKQGVLTTVSASVCHKARDSEDIEPKLKSIHVVP